MMRDLALSLMKQLRPVLSFGAWVLQLNEKDTDPYCLIRLKKSIANGLGSIYFCVWTFFGIFVSLSIYMGPSILKELSYVCYYTVWTTVTNDDLWAVDLFRENPGIMSVAEPHSFCMKAAQKCHQLAWIEIQFCNIYPTFHCCFFHNENLSEKQFRGQCAS